MLFLCIANHITESNIDALFHHTFLNPRVYWYMPVRKIMAVLLNFVPTPVWSCYLTGCREFGNITRQIFRIFPALFYLILKFLDFFLDIWNFQIGFCEYFLCNKVTEWLVQMCSIHQAEFQKLILPISSQTFYKQSSALWFNRKYVHCVEPYFQTIYTNGKMGHFITLSNILSPINY